MEIYGNYNQKFQIVRMFRANFLPNLGQKWQKTDVIQ